MDARTGDPPRRCLDCQHAHRGRPGGTIYTAPCLHPDRPGNRRIVALVGAPDEDCPLRKRE